MALYEYVCESCEKGTPFRFELRMPMKDVVQFAPCPQCGNQAKKVLGSFALLGLAQPGYGDGPPPWDPTGSGGDLGMGGGDPMMGHDHDHGGGGFDMDDDDF